MTSQTVKACQNLFDPEHKKYMNQTNINRFITTSLCGIFRFKKILISKPLCDVRMSSFNSAFAKLDLNYLLDFLPFDIYLYVCHILHIVGSAENYEIAKLLKDFLLF